MDDGHFAIRSKGVQKRTEGKTGRATICVEAMEVVTRDRLVRYLKDAWGITAKLVLSGSKRKAVLVFNNIETAKLHALIAPFVHPSMEYKLLPSYRGRFAVQPVLKPMRYELVALPVTDIHVKPPTRSMHRFDIEVEGSHNYLVDGVVVHNSPETTPGGRALKFYSSIRLDIRRIEQIKDGADVVGNRTRVKVVKNKCAAPFRQAEFDIMYGKGISREGSLLDVALELGFVKKSGAWFTYEGEQLGQGRENVKTFLSENPQLMAEIDDRVRDCLTPKEADEAEGQIHPDDVPITLDS
jgi:recombination protein RecA